MISTLYDLCPSLNSIQVIKSIRISWACHVARVGAGDVHIGIGWGDLREIDNLEYLGGRREDNSKINLQEVGWRGMDWTDLFLAGDKWRALVNGVMKFWGSIKCGGFLDYLRTY